MKRIILYSISALAFLLVACDQDRDETYAEVFDQMTISISNDLYANNLSTAKVKATFQDNLLKEQEITFTTSEGVLYRMPYDPNSTGEKSLTFAPFSKTAEVLLQANTVNPQEEVYVSLTINGFTKDTSISFLPARPNDMILKASPEILSPDEDVEITAQLFRDLGNTSDDIEFQITDSLVLDTSGVGLLWNIPPFTFSSDNEITFPIDIIQYSPGSQLRVFVTTEDADGNALRKSVLIRLE